jgi:hypothetical protein
MKKKAIDVAAEKTEAKIRAKMWGKAATLLARSNYASVLAQFRAEQMRDLDLHVFLVQHAETQTVGFLRDVIIKRNEEEDIEVRDYVLERLLKLSENIGTIIETLDHAHDRAWNEFDKADVDNGFDISRKLE